MEDRVDTQETAPLSWSAARSAKDRHAVGRSVTALLDALAPEQTLTRAEREREHIERHRTPSGCVLQGPNAALSVSWFADGVNETGFGEMHILLWNGVVARRGTKTARTGATVVSTMILRPDESRIADGIWLGTDGVEYDVARLAEYCRTLLDKGLAG